MADKVMRMPDDTIQRAAMPQKEEEEKIQMKAADTPLKEEEKIQKKATDKPLKEEEEMIQKKADDELLKEEEEKIQMKTAGKGKAPKEEEELLQTKPIMMKSEGGESTATPALATQLNSTKGSGKSLAPDVNASMSNAFGTDFSHVRVHTDTRATQMNQNLHAKAFTHGSDVYFNQGQYAPTSSQGKRLLAHELTHIVQQRGTTNSLIQKWDSPEHIEVGNRGAKQAGIDDYILLNSHQRDIPNRGKSKIKWSLFNMEMYILGTPTQKRFLKKGLSYGEIVALSGDFYETFEHLNNAPIKEIYDLLPLISSEDTKTQELQKTTGGRYLDLALRNESHFSKGKNGNMVTWKKLHIKALKAAKKGNKNLAFAINAAADHFLTDRFAGGHIKTTRNEDRDGIPWYIEATQALLKISEKDMDSLSAKLDHDVDNHMGVLVENERGDTWGAYGDENWHIDKNRPNRQLVLEAVQMSVKDIQDALDMGADYEIPEKFKVETIVPIIRSARRLIPKGAEEQYRRAAYDRISKQNSVSDAMGEKYTRPDGYIRDWLLTINDEQLKALPTSEKIRMIKTLLDGWTVRKEIDDIEKICKSVTKRSEANKIREAITEELIVGELSSIGDRTAVRLYLSNMPR